MVRVFDLGEGEALWPAHKGGPPPPSPHPFPKRAFIGTLRRYGSFMVLSAVAVPRYFEQKSPRKHVLLSRAFVVFRRGKRKVFCHLCSSEGRLLMESADVAAAFHFPDKSALGKGWGAWGEGKPLLREQRPDGGRRPCPLRRRKLRASTAEMRGFPSPHLSPQKFPRYF